MNQSLFPSHDHDHNDCATNLMTFAERYCQHAGLRFTKLRRMVLEQIAASHKAIGAYQILDNLQAEGLKIAPISVYRCLDFLQEAGLIHRLESTNAYFACQRTFDDQYDTGIAEIASKCSNVDPLVFLICEDCGIIGEVEESSLINLINSVAGANEFDVERSQLEIKGICKSCQAT